MKPEVTTVIPTHNRRDLLQVTLRSVLDQRDVDLEVVVVDDGSADGTAAQVRGLQDPRIRLIRHDRSTGVSTARNHGADAARGSWLAFCDDDDLWAPDKLARQLAAAAAEGGTWAYGGAVRVDAVLRIMGGAPPPSPERLVERLPSCNTMPGGSSNVIVRREAFRAAGGWNPALINLADWDLWARLAQRGHPACAAEPLVGYRIHQGNSSADTRLILREARLMDGRYGARLDYGELHQYLAWVCLRSGRRWPAMGHFAVAATRGQAPYVARALADLARRRVATRMPVRRLPPEAAHSAWIAAAEAWVAPLRDAVRAFRDVDDGRVERRCS